ncbi:MAG: DNA gyrase subunit A [Candidatus Marinimicrobia bacterium]|jgi:DNA gyrase subunit A|nr:DNA gyrase subunit A [Candidatus Neomarinimicrobiota bacterium]MBT3962353.1 DNA gyrase subunit A [Candidatus Neomarinimicrobiota bacterium]MBT4635306.1 DNA gyrase subunit A [Candidatus Neomarinimicrobiota bacterium]MBT4684772.1 DNA gyrase subunit A [Candidatus Neomarinimicrobiota bacterium]MBT6469764.1 DNA gyrase subunit A [Candidatus Neomarinimicrobiota bacterium]
MVDFNRDNTINRDIVDEMRESYLNYSMSVIVSRALPDVRDGLKPVHRRILFGMNDLGSHWNRAYKKSARIVGDVLGKYHPHGDSSVYDALVRMAQDFSMRYELVDGQGNFGSIDGDNAAAMRYTESRMTRLASEMLKDLDKETVDWVPNFDETLKEPAVLPSMVPTLLVNGSEGIAVGMATKIPPHNLTEIINGLIGLINNKEITVEELQEHIKGPDFPTAGLIMGMDGIKNAYKTGRGIVKMRAKAHIETAKNGKDSIIITELPYQVNKARLIEKIADLVRDKKVVGITDLRDESDKDGIRVVIETKRDAVPEVILNLLYKHTQLQDTFGIILLALYNDVPKIMSLKEILQHFIDFRHSIIVRRTEFDLKEAEARAHILEGLKIALDNIDEVISIIRGSKDPTQAKEGLMNAFNLSEKQCQAILDMRLQKLTGLEVGKVVAEYKEVIQLIAHLKGILESESQRMDIIKSELMEIRENYGDERRTEILPLDADFSMEDMIAEEDVVLTITHQGYIKRTALNTYRTQRRGGRGVQGAMSKDEDFVEHLFIANTHNYMLFFTDQGKCYWLKVYDIPQGGRATRGRAIVNLIGCDTGEKIEAFVSVKEFDDHHFIVMATQNGIVKKTVLSAYGNPRKGGIYAIEVREGDKLIEARITNGDHDILLGTHEGKSIRFSETNVRPSGRKTMGVKGITLSSKTDYVVGMLVVKREGTILVATEKGYGKRTDIIQYRSQTRGGKGVLTMRCTNKTGKMVKIMEVVDSDDLIVITDSGVLMRQPVGAIRTIGRVTQGVRLVKLDDGASISTITRVISEEKATEEPKPEDNQLTIEDAASNSNEE